MLDEFFIRQHNLLKQSQRLSLVSIICLLLFANASPSQAQYFGLGSGWGYNGIGTSLLYPLNSLFYSGYGYGSWPLYGVAALGSGFANNAVYNSYRNIPLKNNNSANTTQNSNNAFNYSGPGNGYNSNLYQASGWNYSPVQTPLAPPTAADPNDIFNASSPPVNTNYPPISGYPALTPNQHPQAQLQNPDARAFNGFFQVINSHYKGDLVEALKQADMRSWASSLGLIQGENPIKNLNKARKNEIEAIVKDTSLNQQKKAEVLRLLLDTKAETLIN